MARKELRAITIYGSQTLISELCSENGLNKEYDKHLKKLVHSEDDYYLVLNQRKLYFMIQDKVINLDEYIDSKIDSVCWS